MKMLNCVVYVAGPYRAPTEREVVENIRRAEAVALEFWKRGVPTICPHMNTRLLGGAAPDEVWLEGDLIMLGRCDALVLVPDWQKSSGTVTERNRAHVARMPVYEIYDGDMPRETQFDKIVADLAEQFGFAGDSGSTMRHNEGAREMLGDGSE